MFTSQSSKYTVSNGEKLPTKINQSTTPKNLYPFNAGKANLLIRQPPKRAQIKKTDSSQITLNRISLRTSGPRTHIINNTSSLPSWRSVKSCRRLSDNSNILSSQRNKIRPLNLSQSFSSSQSARPSLPSKRPISSISASMKSLERRKAPPPVSHSSKVVNNNNRLGNVRSINNRNSAETTKQLLSARKLRINELRNQIEELECNLAQVKKENKLLKHHNFRQERALDKAEASQAELPTLTTRHQEEVRGLYQQIRRLKEVASADLHRLKQVDAEAVRLRGHVARLEAMVEDGSLRDRTVLHRELCQLQEAVVQKDQKISELERHLDNLKNNHKHELAAETSKLRATQHKYETLSKKMNELDEALKRNSKLVSQQNIYSRHRKQQSRNSPTPDCSIASTIEVVPSISPPGNANEGYGDAGGCQLVTESSELGKHHQKQQKIGDHEDKKVLSGGLLRTRQDNITVMLAPLSSPEPSPATAAHVSKGERSVRFKGIDKKWKQPSKLNFKSNAAILGSKPVIKSSERIRSASVRNIKFSESSLHPEVSTSVTASTKPQPPPLKSPAALQNSTNSKSRPSSEQTEKSTGQEKINLPSERQRTGSVTMTMISDNTTSLMTCAPETVQLVTERAKKDCILAGLQALDSQNTTTTVNRPYKLPAMTDELGSSADQNSWGFSKPLFHELPKPHFGLSEKSLPSTTTVLTEATAISAGFPSSKVTAVSESSLMQELFGSGGDPSGAGDGPGSDGPVRSSIASRTAVPLSRHVSRVMNTTSKDTGLFDDTIFGKLQSSAKCPLPLSNTSTDIDDSNTVNRTKKI